MHSFKGAHRGEEPRSRQGRDRKRSSTPLCTQAMPSAPGFRENLYPHVAQIRFGFFDPCFRMGAVRIKLNIFNTKRPKDK